MTGFGPVTGGKYYARATTTVRDENNTVLSGALVKGNGSGADEENYS
ncbi:MAG: hypothetical protein JXJ04_12235 [Spirochaetales bacterium]|nr:hypothetical protein [Spirochaetales bacterium]